MRFGFEDYIQWGGILDETVFNRHVFRACKLIDRLTHGRVKDETPPREAVGRAIAALIEAMAADEEGGGREISSMSNDGLSVSYAVPNGQTPEARYVALARAHLEGEMAGRVALLYAGVDA